MIVILHDLTDNYIQIPSPTTKIDTDLTFCLIDTATRKKYSFGVEDDDLLDNFYTFKFDGSQITRGEYEYTIENAKGILRVK